MRWFDQSVDIHIVKVEQFTDILIFICHDALSTKSHGEKDAFSSVTSTPDAFFSRFSSDLVLSSTVMF